MSKSFQDRFLFTKLSRDEKKVRIAFAVVSILIVALLANSLYLTVLSLQKTQPIQSQQLPLVSPAPTNTPTNVVTVLPTTIPVQNPQNNNALPAVKEYFIPFGAGSNQTSDWTDVPGLTAQIDFGNYARIKEVHFEASVGIPTANESASVRLFNVTDKHPVWYSEITLFNGQFVSSNPIVYDTGIKTYQVQMKTSLQFLANLIQSRIHIILQ